MAAGFDPRPERGPLVEITWDDASLWLNDRCGSIVSITVGIGEDAPMSHVLVIGGDSELEHWSERETPEYVASQMGERSAGSYRLGPRTLVNLGQLAEGSYGCRANNAHLVIDLDSHVSLRITGRRRDQ